MGLIAIKTTPKFSLSIYKDRNLFFAIKKWVISLILNSFLKYLKNMTLFSVLCQDMTLSTTNREQCGFDWVPIYSPSSIFCKISCSKRYHEVNRHYRDECVK